MTSRHGRLAALALLAVAAAVLPNAAWAFRGDPSLAQDKKRFPQYRLSSQARRRPSAQTLGALAAYKQRHGLHWTARFNPRTGALSALLGGSTAPRPGPARLIAAAHLEESRELTQIDLSTLRVDREKEIDGISHVMYQQTYRGIPVEFGRVKVHIHKGSVIGLNSSYEPALNVDVVPSLGSGAAFEPVFKDLGGGIPPAPGSLVIFPDEQSGQPRLAWKYTVRQPGHLWRYYIDAHTGQVLFRYDDLRRAVGTVTGQVFDIDPTSTPVRARPFAHQRVYVLDSTPNNSALTDRTGAWNSVATGKFATALQGPFVNISDFNGPSAHAHNSDGGFWSTVPTPVSSPHPYSNNASIVSTINIAGLVPGPNTPFNFLPRFNNFDVGEWAIDAFGNGFLADDDIVQIVDSTGNAVAAYSGLRGLPFNGASAFGTSLSLRLKSNEQSTRYGYDVLISSYFAIPNVEVGSNGTANFTWSSTHTFSRNLGEINIFYHLNAMHDYFADDVNISNAASLFRPVNALVHEGPNSNNAEYNPDDDNLHFGDVNAAVQDWIWGDATVPHHEYTHFLVEKIYSLQNFGQAGALSEAIADYFAASSLNRTFAPTLNNSSFPGQPAIGNYYNSNFSALPYGTAPLRQLDTAGQCDTNPKGSRCSVLTNNGWSSEIHADSLFLSQALWDLRTQRRKAIAPGGELGPVMGAVCTDRLVFNSLFFFPESFEEFLDAMILVNRIGVDRTTDDDPIAAGGYFTLADAVEAQYGVDKTCGGPNFQPNDIPNAFGSHGLPPNAVASAFEPNDGFTSAVDVSTIPILSAAITPSGDTDFYAFGAGPGTIRIAMDLPVESPGIFKAYAIVLFDRKHKAVARGEPAYTFCDQANCTTEQSIVVLQHTAAIADYYYLRVTGGAFGGAFGDIVLGDNSGVNSTSPYTLQLNYNNAAVFVSSRVAATFDNDLINFSVNVTTWPGAMFGPHFTFSKAQLRDQSLGLLPNTVALVPPNAPLPGQFLSFVTSAYNSNTGTITGELRIQPGFEARFPSVGTVMLEVFAYNVAGSTVSLGVSNPLNLTTVRSNLTAWNNVMRPLNGQKTTIKYDVLQPGRVTIRLFTLNGNLVHTLFDGIVTAGKGSVDWYGRNMNNTTVASGVYLVHINGPGISKTQKIIVVK